MDKENVVFEHIVPRAVKQMWMNTINKQDKDKSRDKQQRVVVKPVLSQEYGDAFISKDLISDQNDAVDTNLERNDSVSESSELTGAHNKWGIILKHVERKEELESQNDKSLPYGFPRLRSLSGNSKKHFDENQSSRNLLTASKRSQSVELLLENDNKDSIIDIEKINRSFTEQDYESVRILGNSFETSHKDSVSNKREKNRINSVSKSDSNILKNQEKVKTNLQNGEVQPKGWSRDSFQKHRTLAELLKNDRLNLTVDVLDEPVQPAKPPSIGNVTPHKLPASSSVELSKSITSPTHPPENIKSPRLPTTYFFTHGHSRSSPRKQDTFSYNITSEKKDKESASGEKLYVTHEEHEKTKPVIEKDIEANNTSELEENITSVNILQTNIKSPENKTDGKNYPETISNAEATTGSKVFVDVTQTKIEPPQVDKEVTKSPAIVNNFDRTVDSEVSFDNTEPKVKPPQNDTVAIDTPLKNDRSAPRVVKVIKTDKKKTDKESFAVQNTAPSKKPKIVGKVLASPQRSQQAIVKEDKKKNVYVFQMDKKQEAVEGKASPTNKPNVKLNKLGQVILDVDSNDMEMTRPSENTTIKGTTIKNDQESLSSQGEIKKINKSVSKTDTGKKPVREVTDLNQIEALQTQKKEKVTTTSSNQKKLTETKEINKAINQEKLQKKSQQSQKEPTVLEASFQLKSEEPTSPPQIKTMENSMNKQRTKKTSLDVAVPFSKPGVEKYVKSEGIVSVEPKQKRRVGRLIIMSGEERDRDLKEKAARKNSGNTTSENVRQVQLKVEAVNSKKKDGFSLTFMSNELGELEDDPNEPPPVVPTIVFNEPVVQLKSMMLRNGNKNRKVRSFRRE